MKLITYQSDQGPRVAGVREDGAVDLNRTDPAVPACIKRLLAAGPEMLARAADATAVGDAVPLEQIELTPPIPTPEKIICVGLNYADHARESGAEPPDVPVIFNKFPSAASAHGRPIVLPRLSQQVDYEAELVAVIGRGGRHIPATGPWSTWLPTVVATTFRPATGNTASRAGSGCWARRSTRSPRWARTWSPPTRYPTRTSWPSNCG